MNKHISLFLSLISAILPVTCSDPVSIPPEIPLETLLASPDTLKIENQSIILKTSLWRDFQPVCPPDGNPLTAFIFIETTDRSTLSSSMNSDAIYVVYENQVWKSFFSTESRPSEDMRPFRITKIARDGPKWGPDVYVDIIVNILVGDKGYFLRAGKQYILRTE